MLFYLGTYVGEYLSLNIWVFILTKVFENALTLFGLGFFCNVFWLWLASVQSKIIVAQICLQILKALEKISKKHPLARLVITSKLGRITLLSEQSKKEWEKNDPFLWLWLDGTATKIIASQICLQILKALEKLH